MTLVRPTGGDDTANLQCALNRGGTVRLAAGTFHTAQLAVFGFSGDLAGAGMNATIIGNLDTPLPVAPTDFYLSAPSAVNPWPSLLAFVEGQFTVSDLTIQISGQQPTTGWSMFGIAPPIKALAHAIVVVGAHADATFERVRVSGEDLPGDLFGLTLINGIFYEGFLGAAIAPIGGSFNVRNSVFHHHASGTPIFNVRHARVEIVHSVYEEMLVGAELEDAEDSTYAFVGNRVEAAGNTVTTYDGCMGGSDETCGYGGSRLIFASNLLEGSPLSIDGTFSATTRCLIVGNSLAGTGDPQLTLGPRTKNVTAIGFSSYLDLGTHNRVLP